MLNNSFFYLFTLSLFKNAKRYISITLLSTVVIFLLSSVLYISGSIKYSLQKQLNLEPDFIVQKRVGTRLVPLDDAIADKIVDIYGISEVTKRVYGSYFFDKEHSAQIVGIDLLDEQASKAFQNILRKEEIKSFLSSESMIVGEGVFNYLKSHFYPKAYNFFTPGGKLKKVKIFKVLDSKSALFSANLIIMPQDLAKEIVGLKENQVTDIALNVPNVDEQSNIRSKLESLFFSARVYSKKQMQEAYENLYNYKGGLFLVLYLVVIATLALILYLRYTLANSLEKKEVAIFRALGWSIKDVITLKSLESISIVAFSFLLGTLLGYIYVFMLGSPLLKNIFLGRAYEASITLIPHIDWLTLTTIFILYATTFLSAVLIPVWRVAVTEPKEALG